MKTAPLRSKDGVTLTKRADQMNRWIEHFSYLHGTERPYTAPTVDKVSSAEIMEELNDEPQFTEMEAVVARLSNNKASGRYAIPADLIKTGRQVLLSPLYSLLLKCWRERTVPHEMRDSNAITLYKNKGDRGDCSNHRGLSLLSVVGKIFARIILTRLQTLAERVYPDSVWFPLR